MILPLNPGHQFKNIYDIRIEIQVRPYSTKELSRLYEVPDKTLQKWLQPFLEVIGCKRGKCHTVSQVEIIFMKLGIPYTIIEKSN